MSKYDYPGQGPANKARVAEQHRATHHARRAASRLLPFTWGSGMRSVDVDVFVGAAIAFNHIIAVRSTNDSSLRYIGRKDCTPKPFDCKIKTADQQAYVAAAGALIACDGLVVDPTVVGFSAFKESKIDKAMEEWHNFLNWQTDTERQRKIFRRRGVRGFFATDTDRLSAHYGCMMMSDQEIPAQDFNLHAPGWAAFKRTHMKYIHGDYDLYGLIDVAETEKARRESGGRDKFSPARVREQLNGMHHIRSTRFEEFKTHINRDLGVPMIQHAGQDNLKHQGDTLYVFYPDGNKYQLTASADAIREIYDHVFLQDVTT